MDNYNKLKEDIKLKIAISKFDDEEKDIVMNKEDKTIMPKLGLVACICLVLTTGIVFAKDIEKFLKENLWYEKGIKTAVENGYVSKTRELSEQSVYIVEDNQIVGDTSVSIETGDFLMTDDRIEIELSFCFEKGFDEYVNLIKLKNGNIDLENLDILELTDFFIVDEDDRIFYFNKFDKEVLQEYCLTKNVDLNIYEEHGDFPITIGFKNFWYDSDNVYGNALLGIRDFSKNFPKSKKLNIYFTKIKFVERRTDKYKDVELKGNWEFHLDIPEVMYNRENVKYKAISYEDENFEVYSAELSETGFEVDLRVHNIEEPPMEYLKELREIEIEKGQAQPYGNITEEDFINFYGNKKYLDIWQEYSNKKYPIRIIGFQYLLPWAERTDGCYVLNNDNEKFDEVGGSFMDWVPVDGSNKKELYYKGYFEMTKYDATDEITLVIDYKGQPVKIKLERIN